MANDLSLDDTSKCCLEDLCESCGKNGDCDWGADGERLRITTLETPVGVFCATLCAACIEAGRTPKIRAWSDAIRRVCDHCVHLGCTVDEMGDAMQRVVTVHNVDNGTTRKVRV